MSLYLIQSWLVYLWPLQRLQLWLLLWGGDGTGTAPGAKWGGMPALSDAFTAMATLRHLGGNQNGAGDGCPGPDDAPSMRRRYFHHATFYGFMMCFASTSVGTLYHYLLGREAPYGYFELPVLLGTVGYHSVYWHSGPMV